MTEEINNTQNQKDEIDWSRFDDMFSVPSVEEISVMSKEKAEIAEAARAQMIAENEAARAAEVTEPAEEMVMVYGEYNDSRDADEFAVSVGWHLVPVEKAQERSPEEKQTLEELVKEIGETYRKFADEQTENEAVVAWATAIKSRIPADAERVHGRLNSIINPDNHVVSTLYQWVGSVHSAMVNYIYES